jgi:Coenzyme PQQ synthesis protein D (PqqD)
MRPPMTDRPVRSAGLDITPVADGYVIYDRGTDLVHHLNHTAAMVLELCTGRDTANGIAAVLADAFGPVPDLDSAVSGCIDQLRGLGLVRPLVMVPVQPRRA